MSDNAEREWRFYLDDMIAFAEKVIAYTDGLDQAAFVMPHFDAIPLFGKPLVSALRGRLKAGEIMIGIDEDTAIVGKQNEEWIVLGHAKAHVFTKNESRSYSAGEKFSLGN